jgi:hypothetical protein
MDLHNLHKRIQELRREMSDLVAIDKENRTINWYVGRQHQMEHQAHLTRIQQIKEELRTLAPRREIVNPSLIR